MGSNKDRGHESIYKTDLKIPKRLRSTTFAIKSGKSNNFKVSNRENFNIAIAILEKLAIW